MAILKRDGSTMTTKAKLQSEPRAAPQLQFNIEDHIFSVEDAATHVRVSKSFFYELVAAKKIKLVKQGKRSMVTGREIKRYINSL